MIAAWLSLHRAAGCSLRAKKAALQEHGGDVTATLDYLKGKGVQNDESSDRRVQEQVKKLDGWIMTFGDKDYPELLKEIADPPLCLFGVGDRSALSDQPSPLWEPADQPSTASMPVRNSSGNCRQLIR